MTAQLDDTPSELLEGQWTGESREGGARRRFMSLTLCQNPDCSWYAQLFMTGPPDVLLDEPCETRVRGGAALLTVRTPDRYRRIIAATPKLGDRMVVAVIENDATGTRNDQQAERGPVLSKYTFELYRVPKTEAGTETRAYAGQLEMPNGGREDVALVLTRTPDLYWIGHIDLPGQALLGVPLTKVVVAGNVIDAVMPAPAPARFSGFVDPSGDVLTVSIRQMKYTSEVKLHRVAPFRGHWKRPQLPVPPLGYSVRHVSIEHADGHRLTGTLTIPADSGLHPAVLLLSGSGRQDRDYQIYGHPLFAVLADRLTQAGLAVLRLDDRGVGGSTGDVNGDEMTLLDHAADALAAIEFLRDSPKIDPCRIGLIGHSQGGLVAPLAANLTPPIAWVVLLAAPGTIGYDSLTAQVFMQWLRRGVPRDLAQRNAPEYRRLLEDVINGASEQNVRERLRAMIEEHIAAGAKYPGPDRVVAIVERETRLLQSPSMRMMLPYDPTPALSSLRCPVLALHGSRDDHLWLDQELFAIVDAVGRSGRGATITTCPNLDHFFQPVRSTVPAADEVTFDESAMTSMIEWIVTVAPTTGETLR